MRAGGLIGAAVADLFLRLFQYRRNIYSFNPDFGCIIDFHDRIFSGYNCGKIFANFFRISWQHEKQCLVRPDFFGSKKDKNEKESLNRLLKKMRQLPKKVKVKKVEQTHFDFSKGDGKFQLPPFTLLEEAQHKDTRVKRDYSDHQFPHSGKEVIRFRSGRTRGGSHARPGDHHVRTGTGARRENQQNNQSGR